MTGTENQDRAVFCEKNPALAACGGASGGGGGSGDNNGTFSGDCTGAFACTGDPVLCAAAKSVASMNCQLQKQPGEIAKYDAAKALTGNRTTELPGNSTTAITSELFNRADPLGSGTGTCITDRTITVMNRSIAIPFSTVCPHLDLLRQMLQAVSYLVAAGIVFKRG